MNQEGYPLIIDSKLLMLTMNCLAMSYLRHSVPGDNPICYKYIVPNGTFSPPHFLYYTVSMKLLCTLLNTTIPMAKSANIKPKL